MNNLVALDDGEPGLVAILNEQQMLVGFALTPFVPITWTLDDLQRQHRVEQVVALLRAKAKLAGMLIEDRMIDATQACLEYLETAVPPEQRPSWLTESPEDTPQAWR